MIYTAEDIESLSRKELQSLAKEHNLKANKKSNELIAELKSILCQELPASVKELIVSNDGNSSHSEAKKPVEDLNDMIGNNIVILEPTIVLQNENISVSAPISINQKESSQNVHQNDDKYEILDDLVQVGKSVYITISGEEFSGIIKRINKKTVRIILKDGSEVTHPTSDIRESSYVEKINQQIDCYIEPSKSPENTQSMIQMEDATQNDALSFVSESPATENHEAVTLEFAAQVDELLHGLTDIPTSPTNNHLALEVTTTSTATTPNKSLNFNRSPLVIPFSVGRSNVPLISQPTPSKSNYCSFLKSKTPSKDPKYAPKSNKTQIMREDAIRKKSLANYNRAKIPLKSPGSNPIHRKSSIITSSTSANHKDNDKEVQRKRKIDEIRSIKSQMELEEDQEVAEDTIISKVAKIGVDVPPNVSTTRGPFTIHQTKGINHQSKVKSLIPKPLASASAFASHGARQSSSAIQTIGAHKNVPSKPSSSTSTSTTRTKIAMPDFGKMHERQFSKQKSITSVVPTNGVLAQRMTSALVEAQQPPPPAQANSNIDITTGNTTASSTIDGSTNDSKASDSVSASAKKVSKAAWEQSFHSSQTKIHAKDIFAEVDKENFQNHNSRVSGNNLKQKGKEALGEQKQFQRKLQYLSKGMADRASTISGMRKNA